MQWASWTVRTDILPVVLYGCESGVVTLRAKHRLGVFEKRLLRRIFGYRGPEGHGDWRRLHNEERHGL
jgi:hypothetical protein